MAAIEMAYDLRTPSTSHEGLAAAQFYEHFSELEGSVLNVAAGQTNLQADLQKRGVNLAVVSLDPKYNDRILHDVPNRVRAVAQDIPYDDETFGLTMCQFGLQHLLEQDVPQAIREMIRVTRTATDIRDESQGTILLNPIFQPKRVKEGIVSRSLLNVCGIQNPPLDMKSRNALPTLAIKKTSALTEEKTQELIDLITESGSFKPTRRSLGELASRAFGGFSEV